MAEKEIGKVQHFFDKISVAVITLSHELKTGDKIRIEAMVPFVQTVSSMQVHHKTIDAAKAGDEIAMKVDKKCNDSDKVIKLE